MSKETSIPVVDEDAAEAAATAADAEAASAAAPEQTEPATPPEPPAEDAATLRAELDQALRDLEEQRNDALRARAELDNVRKRSARDVENARKFGVERLVMDLLPVKDSMEMGLKAAAEDGADVDKVREGLDLTLKMLAGSLQKLDVEEIDPVGQPFDPEFHEAMAMQPSTEAPPDTVVTVFQKGYVLAGRLVRPAMVVVATQADG